QATPLVVYLFLKYLARPRVASALYFACSLLLIIPALQISYLAAIICLAFAAREIALRGWRVLLELAELAVAVVAANAFYIFSMLADVWLNNGGNIALVNQRFNMGVFEHYAANVSVFNTLRLQSFYYSSIPRQPFVVALGVTLLPLLLLGLLLLARKPVARSMFYWGAGVALLGIWLVDGITLAPDFYTWFHFAIPGVRSFVEPDYFTPLYVFGAFLMLAAAVRVGTRAYGSLWQAAVWIVALSGIVPFLPINGGASGLPRTGQPRQYRDFSQAHVQGNTLWLPPDRGVQYRWSPYTINGFTSLNSPTDAIGPTMAEWVSPGTARIQTRLASAFLNVQPKTVEALAPLMGVGTIALAADSLSPDFQWPDPEILASLETAGELRRAGFLSLRDDYRDIGVHLITATTLPPYPEVGMYDQPVNAGGFDNFMWWTILSARPRSHYVPVAADLASRATFGGSPLQVIPPAPTLQRTIPIAAFDDCTTRRARMQTTRAPASLFIQTKLEPRCFSFPLPHVPETAALQATLDAQPDTIAQAQLGFKRRGHDIEWVDPALAAQEVPPGTQSARLVVRVAPYSIVTLRDVRLRWAPRHSAPVMPATATCRRTDVSWSEQNPMAYTIQANISGRCTVVFRQSFAPVWALLRTGGSAKVLGHLQVDGFANAWVVEGSGPVTFRVVNLALFPYAAGMALTIASVALVLGFAVRSGLSRSPRRASQAQPTA
ncbi:MAG: hypothetical protein JOY69_03620, partial [Candidatus Eremiobacteraeota bacterium]|nr:hypothetical protein [Candidatus Eremiobacteraeota bacterium]